MALPAVPSDRTHDTDKALSPEEIRAQYRELARAVVEMAWRDAQPESRATSEVRDEAIEFLASEEAEFWSSVAGVNLARLRRLLLVSNGLPCVPSNAPMSYVETPS